MAKIALTFDIVVAVIGQSAAGKTTLINGLLRGNYGEVSMKQEGTTAGVYIYCLYPKPGEAPLSPDSATSGGSNGDDTTSEDASSHSSEGLVSSGTGWAMVAEEPRTAESILEEITKHNAELRKQGGDEVVEKTFEVELSENLVDMRKDTKLVLVDVPGFDCYKSSSTNKSKYQDYVEEKWDTFDCVIIVMDGRQSVDIELLELAKASLKKKHIPIIIVSNKVDDPEKKGQAELLLEARRKVEKSFVVPDREEALRALVESCSRNDDGMFPVFIPMSAENGSIFRCASLMTLEQFKKFDRSLIEKLGQEWVGRKDWRQTSADKRFKRAHGLVMDPEVYKSAVEESNFAAFLLALSFSIGGEDVQCSLIQKQIKVSLNSVKPGGRITTHLRSAYMKTQALSIGTRASTQVLRNDTSACFDDSALKDTFWRVYKESEKLAFNKFKSSPSNVNLLVNPLHELVDYYRFSEELGFEDEYEKINGRAKALIQRQIKILMGEESKPDSKTFSIIDEADGARQLSWRELSPLDWSAIVSSIPLISYDRFFCEDFGREKIMLEASLDEIRAICKKKSFQGDPVIKCPAPSCASILNFNRFCTSCNKFAHPDAGVIKNGQLPCPFKDCGGCTTKYVRYNYWECSTCGFQFLRTHEKIHVQYPFSCQGCKKDLDFNRRCGNCKSFCLLSCTNSCPFCSYTINFASETKQNCPSCLKTIRKAKEAGSLETKYKGGKLHPIDPGFYNSVVRLEVPESPSDQKHFGHLAWKYCQFMASIEK